MSVTILILCIKIFLVRICDVSLGTIRMIITVKGKASIAALIGFIEVLIWFLVVREALATDVGGIFVAFAYSAGYATGTLIGSYLSNKFISGNLTLQIVLSNRDEEAINSIRKAGYAVTVIEAKGQDEENPKYMLFMEINKKRLGNIRKLIKNVDEKAFIVVNETKLVQNGYFK